MKSYKTEIKLTEEQKHLYKLTVSACRFVYNLFISVNQQRYKDKEKYMNNYGFSKWFNNIYLKENEDKLWLKKAGSKAIQRTIDNCNRTYKEAFKKSKGFPKFKKSSTDKTGLYFVRTRIDQHIKCYKHKIRVPMLGWITLKEKNYLPVEQNRIISGTITKRANRYFISVLADEETIKDNKNTNEGIGIDLGIKTFMTCSNNLIFENINKSVKVKKLEKSLRRQQRALSRKFEKYKETKIFSNNFNKNKLKVEKLYYRLENIKNSYINKCVDKIVQCKPNFITLEKLNIKGMLKNRHLSKSIKDSKFYYTKQIFIQKATKHNIEVREVGTFYPSSKKCSKCSTINKDLKLKDRIYKCSCGNEIDRDLNASINLKNCKEYKIINSTDGLSGINACGVLQETIVASNSEIEHEETRKSNFIVNIKFSTGNIKF